MTPEQIATAMTGRIVKLAANHEEAFLPSPKVQNHAAFLHLHDDTLICAWFGGTLEGKSDICIYASVLPRGAAEWGPAQQLSFDPDHSEQNPVLFTAPDGRLWLFHTSQPSGNQDECRLRMAEVTLADNTLTVAAGRYLDLPRGSFVRGRVLVRKDGGWLLPIFRCISRPGQKWTGSHDTAAVAVSDDGGETWQLQDIRNSTGDVHMSPVEPKNGVMPAFFRRRQADRVYRSESDDHGHGWRSPKPTDLPNNNSSIAAIRLRDGRIALICNPVSAEDSTDRRASLYDELGENDDRPDADPTGGCLPVWGVRRAPVAVCFSSDNGLTFPVRAVIEDGSGTCLSNDSTDGRNLEMSYPSILEGPHGTLHIAYTYHRRAIKYVRLSQIPA